MSVKENRCRKFQGNIFHQSKCQNCFQPRESHLLNDEDLSQAKPIYGGWLLLAPDGSHLDRPFHRTRKWQRRFFVLYEHGLLRYALDDLPTTLPQGSIDMNRCCDVTDGESRTAHENSLCILTPEKEHFLRAECKTSINGWQEALSVYPRTNKQNQKKKRKVEPPTRQEPGPAKVTVTSGASADGIPRLPGGIAGAERVPMGRATSWREENRRSRPTAPWSRSASFLGRPERSQMGSTGATQDDGGAMSAGRKVRVESAYFSLEKTKSEPSPKPAQISLPPRQLSPSTSSSSAGPEAPLSASPLPPCELYSAIGSSLDGEPDDETPSREGRRAAAGGSVASATRGGAGAALSDVPPARGMPSREASASEKKPRDLRARTQSPGREEVARLFGEERRRWQVIVRFEESPNAERMDTSGRSEPSSNVNDAQRRGRRSGRRDLSDRCDARSDAGKERRVPDAASGSAFANLGRAKSLERRVGESATTPDLLDFKKGWLSKLNDHGTWKKHWFVLTDQSLRYYKDSLAEEASEADGEIHLSACCDVQEFPVPRNYGFRILCQGGACTLSAMTSGIRRNWIQAIANNARSAVAPDVTRSVPEVNPQGRAEPEPSPRPEPPDGRPWPSGGNGASAPPSEPRKSRLGESRREGRSKALDRSQFQIDETGEPAKEPADAVDRGPSLSTPASCCSSPSSSSSSPVRPHPTSPIEDDVSPPPNTLLPKSPVRPSLPQSPERGRMRVDRPSAPRHVEGEKLSVASSAKEEIEQRWLQVETTPLREEKQVAIAVSSEDADGPPPRQLAALLDNELGQKQKVLEQLQRQNSKLQEQLGDALGREESARDGYVPQSAAAPPSSSSSSSPRRVPRQAWHKLNRDLQSASESPKRKRVLDPQPIQTLERNSAEGRTAPDHREAHVVAPRSSASEEILASERAVARMRNQLHLERDPSKEQEEEYARTRATLRARLEDGQSRLREAEDSLLERSRALRHLERQRALRPDHTGEVQSLRERLREVTACLLASQQGRALKEQRLREEQRGVGESHRTERQSPRPRRAEAQAAREQTEAERHGEAPLGGRRGSAARARGEELPQPRQELAPKSGALESLRESVRRLQEEKGPLTRRCRQLLDQIALADGELGELCGRLQTEEAHYCSLEKSYERATRDFERMSQLLREKDREILRAEGTYRSLLERKEEDLKEALVKMSALGNSLEETERELRAKEDLLSQMSRRPSCRVEAAAGAAQQNLKAEPALAEKRVAELRRHPDALRPGNAHLHSKRKRGRERESHPTTAALTSDGESPLSFGAASRTEDSADDDESPGDWRSFDDARNQQDSDLAQALAGDSDKLISIVHALETKLLATEEKLKCLTGTLREHRQTHASNQEPKTVANEPRGCESVPGIAAATAAYAEATAAYAEALLCVETSRQKVETFLADSRQFRSLAEVPHQLFRASAHIRRGQKTSEEQWPRRPATQIWELFQQEAAPLFAQTLSLEALVLDQMAALLRTPESDLLLRTLTAIWEDVENIPSGDHDCLAEVYAHVLTRKWTLESVRWEAPEREAPPRGGGSNEADAGAEAAVNASAIFNALVEAELSYSVGNLKLGYREKLRLLEGELAEGRRQLSPRGAASEAILEASEGARLKSAIREAKADFGSGPPTSAAVCPPELAPYAEQIEWQEARRLAEKVAERRLADKMPPCAVDHAESLRSARESLAVELRQQAAKLREYAQEIQSAGGRPQLAQTLGAVLGPRASRRFTGASLCMREALVQSQVAYVACRLRAARKSTSARRRETRRSADALVGRRPGSVGAVREKYEYETERGALEREMDRLSKRQERGGHFQMQAEERERREDSLSEGAADGRQRPKEDPPAVKERHRNGVKKLKDDFERQIAPIRRIRRDEVVGSRSAPGQSLAKLPADGSRRRVASSSPTEAGERRAVSEGDAAVLLKDRIRQPEAQMNAMRDEVDGAHPQGHVAGLRLKSQRDLESLKATCERGFAAMEESHHKVVRDLQRQHRREISKLTEERERLLAEETAATVAAIEAMKNAHEEELEKNRRSQLSGLDADIDQLRLQYQEELRSIQRELEVLSEQYSQKCLENAHLARALEAERQALGRCRRENRELHAHNQELNDRLRAEIARMRSRLGGETAPSPATPGKDVYELEVLLRVKESEIRYLKREIHSLKDELQSALRDEKYAADKRKDLHSELSVAKAKADCEIGKLKEKLHIATRALGDRSVSSGYDVTKSKSNPDLMEKEQTTTSEPSGSVGSKSLKEGLTVQERMKLFQAKESEKI